jgi:hypothetical protein
MVDPGHRHLISRRSALRGGLAAAWWPLTWDLAKASQGPMADHGRLRAFAASDPAAARTIGEGYLKAHANEVHAGILVSAVLARLELDPEAMQAMSAADLRERIDAAISDDFAADDVVALDGWVLSRTEARLCALVALAPR